MYPPDYPREYIDGTVTFFSREFRVTPAVLIPRLETETLVRAAIACCRGNAIDTLIDVGTGSGIIPVSVGANVSGLRLIAVDVSHEALAVAEENARRNAVEVTFCVSDLLGTFLAER